MIESRTTHGYTIISYDELCQALYEAVEGISGDTLLKQHDEGIGLSYARISHLLDVDGNAYKLVQVEEFGAKVNGNCRSALLSAIEELREITGSRPDCLMDTLDMLKVMRNRAEIVTIH